MTKQSKFFNELQTVRLLRSARNDTFYKGVKNIFPLIFAFLIFIFAFSVSSFAEDIYESRLDRGLENNEPYSYVLIKKGQR